YRLSVPNNAMDIVTRAWARGNETGKDANVATHKAMKTVHATAMIDGDSVQYLWPLLEPVTEEVREFVHSIAFAAQRIVALGWGIDMAIGHADVISATELQEISAGEYWSPAARSDRTKLRVAIPGTLDALRLRHRQ